MKKTVSKISKKRAGISLVEILISLSIFSIGIIGLYLSIQSMNKSLQISMQRDVEAAYANKLIAEVNPHRIDVETAYDTSGSTKVQLDLPDQRKVWYLRRVDSCPIAVICPTTYTPDVKNIHVYFYRNQNDPDSSPYRHFKREIAVKDMCYRMSWAGGPAPQYNTYKDTAGQNWTLLETFPYYSATSGSRRAGIILADVVAEPYTIPYSSPAQDVVGAVDQYPWQNVHSVNDSTGNGTLSYRFPASIGHNYTISLGLREYEGGGWAGSDVVDIFINGTKVAASQDIFLQSGSVSTGTLSKGGVVKTFSAPGINDGSGNGILNVKVVNNGSSAFYRPTVAWICIER